MDIYTSWSLLTHIIIRCISSGVITEHLYEANDNNIFSNNRYNNFFIQKIFLNTKMNIFWHTNVFAGLF